MLLRIITGVVGIGLAAAVIQAGGQLFALCALLLAVLAWMEYVRAFAHKGGNLAFLIGIVAIVSLWGCAWKGFPAEAAVMVLTLAALACLLAAVLLRSQMNFVDAALSVCGIYYLGLPFAHMVLLRSLEAGRIIETSLLPFEYGAALVWVMFIGTWASDTFAYFVGSAIGSHKLCPSISPNKTIEGFMGSVVGTTATVAGLGAFFSFPVLEMAALGLAISIFATLGDLVESVAKRHVGIKDSGNIIPGHGGVWDRFDSVLFTAPLVYYFVVLTNLLGKGAL